MLTLHVYTRACIPTLSSGDGGTYIHKREAVVWLFAFSPEWGFRYCGKQSGKQPHVPL